MSQLLKNATADGNGAASDWNGNQKGTLQIVGTWDGATVTIYGSLNDGEDYAAPSNSAYTADVITSFEMGPGKVRATVSNAGSSTDLNAYVSPG